MRLFLLVVLFSLLIFPIFAQYESDAVPITAANIHQLQSVAQINFADLDAEFDTGWFDMSSNGGVYVGITNNQRFYVFPSFFHVDFDMGSGESIFGFEGHPIEQTNVEAISITVETAPADRFYGLLLFNESKPYVYQRFNRNDESRVDRYPIPIDGIPINIWSNCRGIYDNDLLFCNTWIEVRREQETFVIEFPVIPSDTLREPIIHPYAPAQDPDAIVRIGRIPPPYTVTSSREGIVKLWNIQTGQVVYEVDNSTGEAAVFGAINPAATHLVWRDSRNEALYLLNFETGENRYLANLNGQYAQWYFLSNDASVALAVNLGFEPNIVAWDTTTGEQTVLGEYRQCNRPQPDMARLSADGTTLVIGCDTGLDIWRIVEA